MKKCCEKWRECGFFGLFFATQDQMKKYGTKKKINYCPECGYSYKKSKGRA